MLKIKKIEDIIDKLRDNKEILECSQDILNIIDSYDGTELQIFNDLLMTQLRERVGGEYVGKDNLSSEIFTLAESIGNYTEGYDVDSILKEVINYSAIFYNNYPTYITNCFFNTEVWWIKKMLEA